MPRALIETLALLAIFVAGSNVFLLRGIFPSLQVASGSMAPSLLGPHYLVVCERCAWRFAIDVQSPPRDTPLCPLCGSKVEAWRPAKLGAGDFVLIDRTRYQLFAPRRWEIVALDTPSDHVAVAVKRIVGLPGERVCILNGEVHINGRVLVKPRGVQKALAQRVFDGRHSAPSNADSKDSGPRTFGPYSDDCSYNQGESRRLQRVNEGSLCCVLQPAAPRKPGVPDCEIDWSDGRRILTVRLNATTGAGALSLGPTTLETFVFQAANSLSLEFSVVDGVAQIWTDNRNVLKRDLGAEFSDELAPLSPVLGGDRAADFTWRIRDESASVVESSLEIFRDVSYLPDAALELAADYGLVEYRLDDGEYFVLGDNPSQSEDSRVWHRHGPLKRGQLLGPVLRLPF